MKKIIKKARWFLIPAALAAVVWLWVVKFESGKPEIRTADDKPFLGRELSFRATDRKSGLAGLRVEAVQAGRTVDVFSEKFPEPLPSVVKTISLRPLPAGLTDGEVLLRISAEDRSWNGGNTAVYEKRLIIDTRPPQMTILGGPHYLNRGGAGVVACSVEEGTAIAGIQVGERFFPDFPKDRICFSFSSPCRLTRPTTFLSSEWPKIRPATGRMSSFVQWSRPFR